MNKTYVEKKPEQVYKLLTKTFALICCPIDEYFGTDNITKRKKHLH